MSWLTISGIKKKLKKLAGRSEKKSENQQLSLLDSYFSLQLIL